MPADQSFTLSSISAPMIWKNQPSENTRVCRAANWHHGRRRTDWSISPAGGYVKSNAPIALLRRRTTPSASSQSRRELPPPTMPEPCSCTQMTPSGPSCVSNTRPSTTDDRLARHVVTSPTTGISGVEDHRLTCVSIDMVRSGLHHSLDGHYWHFVRQFPRGIRGRPERGLILVSNRRRLQNDFSEIGTRGDVI